MKDKSIIIDLDGTLCDNRHRLHYIEKKPKDWNAYNAHMSEDSVNEWCEILIRAFCRDGFDILAVTGRDTSACEVTGNWYIDKWLPIDRLFMRQVNDHRPDYVIKEEILKNEILPFWEVVFAIDDRQQVIDMWRRNGIVALQCAKGDF